MLKTPLHKRRGTVTQETGSWAYLLQDEPDKVLDALLASKVIGAARRDCLKEVRNKSVPRPVGPWAMLIRLKGQPWTYVVGDGMRFEWPKEWAEKYGRRVAWFSLDGMSNRKIARLYDGAREIFNFVCGAIKEPEEGFAFHELEDDSAMIRGEAKECSTAWLKKLKSGGDAMDKLARLADAYLPVWLGKGDEEGQATVHGWDGDPYPDEEEDAQDIPDSAFERIDVFTFGGPETLEPSAAAIALGKAVRAGDAEAAAKALKDGADPNLMYDDDESPLEVALNLGSPFLEGGRFAKTSLERQLALMEALLKGGANPDHPGRGPAIHWAIHWADCGDEKDLVAQLRLLLKYKADPNSVGDDLRSAGQRPLHVVATYQDWPAVIKLLIQHGADPNLTNQKGETARQCAVNHRKMLDDMETKLIKSLDVKPLAEEELPASADMGESASIFAKLMTSDNPAEKTDMRKSLFGHAMKAARDEEHAKREGLAKSVALLIDAEQGKLDFTDIDALCAASSAKYLEAKRIEEKQRAAALSSLGGAIKMLGAKYRDMSREMMGSDVASFFGPKSEMDDAVPPEPPPGFVEAGDAGVANPQRLFNGEL